MLIKKSNLFITIILLLSLAACNSSITTATATLMPALPTSTQPVLSSTSTPVLEQGLTPSSTEIQLPYNLVEESSEYCQPPYALLPVNDFEDISEDEIVYKLVEIWLRRYKDPNAHPYCRIDGYNIDKVYDDPDIISQQLEPRGDFMRVVVFSVKLIQIPNDWMSFSGELDQSNWLHLSQVVAAFKTNEGYIMKFAYP